MWSKGHLLQSGKYEIQKQLGVGGFGLTYLAVDTFLKRQVVIKTPNQLLQKDREYEKYVRRFQREGQALAQIAHPNVVPVIEYFESIEMPCLVMAFVEGVTLNERIREQGKLPQSVAVRGFIKLAGALHLLHKGGLIHCDLHPGNVILRPDNELILIDFGSAKLVQPATVTLTTTINTNFSPYEQGLYKEESMQDKKLQATLDVYGLSATLYFAITAQRPMSSISRKLYGDKLEAPQLLCEDIPDWLSQSILKGMALEAEDRPDSMEAWSRLLHPPQATQLPSLEPPPLPTRSNPVPRTTPAAPSPAPQPTPTPQIAPAAPTPTPQPAPAPLPSINRKPLSLALMWIAGVFGIVLAVFAVSNNRIEKPLESRLDTVLERGNLICGVDGGIPGFSFVDNGEYTGLDVDTCKAVAAALFDDPNAVEYRNLDSTERFEALKGGEVDMLARNTTWTLSRDTNVGMEFAPTTFYDGQAIMVRQDSGISDLQELDVSTVCVEAGTTTELNLTDVFKQQGIRATPMPFTSADAAYEAYEAGACDGMSSDSSQLVARRSTLPNPNEHILLGARLSKEPLGPLVVNNDSAWFDAVKWIVYALIQAEEYGLTANNISEAANSENPEIRRFVGATGTIGEDIGLPDDFAARAVEAVGNYGEIFERNLGKGSQFQLERGQNALWSDGGLMYSPPWR